MKREEAAIKRNLNTKTLTANLVVAGGGLSGVCAAITAARQGLKVLLVQDRPVLGGNASSEVRLWILGATSHMGNNNRWAREGGVIDELLVENTYKNPEGNPLILDMILLDKVTQEKNITLLLNTAVYSVNKTDADTIESTSAFCSQNSTVYILKAPLFCDATGDGILGFLSGAAFRMGAERREEFGEAMAPTTEYGELLGHSLYFYSKDTGKPVNFTPPSFALTDITQIPRFKQFNTAEFGCKLWWVEYGGRLDTVHDTELIKWELWKIVYGVWNYIKNSGNFPEAETLTLEWVGTIPGKRESRRFEGDYMLTQHDLVKQNTHPDAVAYGGWSIDLHPADGIYSERPGCNQWHGKGIFQIPYRTLYSKNISNLFLTGRIISVSHVAFGATRVMATCAYVGQAAGMAAVLCHQKNIKPKQILTDGYISQLQLLLHKNGQYIPGVSIADETDLVKQSSINASSQLKFNGFANVDLWKELSIPAAQMLPLIAGKIPVFNAALNVLADTTLVAELMTSSIAGNFTPDKLLGIKTITLKAGKQLAELDFDTVLPADAYVFVMFKQNPQVQMGYTHKRVSGIVSVFNSVNKAVSNNGRQVPPPNSGVDEFEFWCPQRRPDGHNLAISFTGNPDIFKAENISNGVDRPTFKPNAWVAGFDDPSPRLTLQWDIPQTIKQIDLCFDTDFDHPMESVLMTHPETVMPFCVRNYVIKDAVGNIIATKKDNYQTANKIVLDTAITTTGLTVNVEHPSANVPAAIFAIRCYSH